MSTVTKQPFEAQRILAGIEAFEDRYDYDATYMKEMLRTAPEALVAFQGFIPMAQHRLHAPVDTYFTAKIAAMQIADCGPCLQLTLRMARESGMSSDLIQAVLDPDRKLPSPLDRVRDFATALLQGSSECESLRHALIEDFGAAAVIEITLGVAAAQIFPVVKRGMGHYQSCSAFFAHR